LSTEYLSQLNSSHVFIRRAFSVQTSGKSKVLILRGTQQRCESHTHRLAHTTRRTDTHTHTHALSHKHTLTHTHTHTHTHAPHTHTRKHSHTHTHTHTHTH